MTSARAPTGEDGFTLVELLVAFAIASLALTGIYTAIGLAARTERIVQQRTDAALAAQSQLDRIVASNPPLGERQWQDPDGFHYNLSVRPMRRLSSRRDVKVQPVQIDLIVKSASGATLLALTTVSFAGVER